MTDSIIKSVVIVIVVATVSYIAFQLGQKALRDNAVDMCMKAGVIVSENAGNRYSQPMKEVYENCMKEKGYK